MQISVGCLKVEIMNAICELLLFRSRMSFENWLKDKMGNKLNWVQLFYWITWKVKIIQAGPTHRTHRR